MDTLKNKGKEEKTNSSEKTIGSFLAQYSLKSDDTIKYILLVFFILGVAFSFVHGTWIIAIPLGGFCTLAFFISQYLAPRSEIHRYIAACNIPIFTAQFTYQLHGAPEANIFYFIGATALLLYCDWKVFAPSSILFFLHLVIFYNLHNGDPNATIFESGNKYGLVNLITLFIAGLSHAIVCIWWALSFRDRSIHALSKVGNVEHYAMEVAQQKEKLAAANISLETQLEEFSLKFKELNDKIRAKDGDILALKTQMTIEKQEFQRTNKQLHDQLHSATESISDLSKKVSFQKNIFEKKNALILTTDSFGAITGINTDIENILGFTQIELMGRPIFSLLKPENLNYRIESIKKEYDINDNNTAKIFTYKADEQLVDDSEWIFLQKSGNEITIKTAFSAVFDGENKLIGYTAIGINYTEIIETKEMAKNLRKELELKDKIIEQNLADLAKANEKINSLISHNKEREEFFETIFTNLPVAVFLKEIHKNEVEHPYIFANPIASDLFGITEQNLGKKPSEIYPTELAERIKIEDLEIITNKESILHESYEIQSELGNKSFLEYRKTPICDATGNLKYILGVAENITEKFLSQQFTNSILEFSPIPFIITGVNDGKLKYANKSLGDVILIETEKLIGQDVPNFYYDSADRTIILQKLKEEGFVSNYELRFVRGNGVPFWASLNLRLAELNGEKCLLGAFIDIDEQKRASQRIAQSEARLNEAMEVANLATWELDLKTMEMSFDGRFVQWLQEAEGIKQNNNDNGKQNGSGVLKMNAAQFIQKYVHENDRALFNKKIEKMIRAYQGDEMDMFEYRTETNNGSKVIQVKIRAIQDNLGSTIKCLATSQDVTEIKLAQKQILESTARFEEAIELAELVTWEYDILNSEISIDNRFAKLLGERIEENLMLKFKPEEFIQKHIGIEYQSTFISSVKEMAFGAKKQTYEFEIKNTKGDSLFLATGGRGILRNDQPILIIGAAHDITHRKLTQDSALKAQSKLNDAMRIAQLSAWDLDLTTMLIRLDNLHLGWMDLPPSPIGYEDINIMNFVAEFVEPEDHPLLQEKIESVLNPENDDFGTFEYRLNGKKGTKKSLRVLYRALENDGNRYLVSGTTQDITGDKLHQQQIEAEKSRFDAMAKNVPGIIFQLKIDQDNNVDFLYVSDAVNQILNLKVDDVLKDASLLLNMIELKYRNFAFDILSEIISRGVSFSREFKIDMHDGTTKWGRLSGTPLLLNKHEILIDGVLLDITLEKNTEIEREERQIRILKQEEAINKLGRSELITSGEVLLALQFVFENVFNTMDLVRGELWRFSENSNEAVIEYGIDIRGNDVNYDLVLSSQNSPNLFESILTEENQAVKYLSFDKRTSELRDEFAVMQVNSALIIPLRIKGKHTGFLFMYHSGPARNWSTDEVSFLYHITEIITIIYESKEKNEATEKLKISDATFNALEKSIPGAIYQSKYEDNQISFSFVSAPVFELAGIKPEDIYLDPNTLLDQIHPEDIDDFFVSFMGAVSEARNFKWEGRGIHKLTQEVKWIEIVGSNNRINENLTIGSGIILDISERKNLEKEKEAKQERMLLQDAAITQLTKLPEISEGRIEEAYPMILEAISNVIGVARVSVWYADDPVTLIDCRGIYLEEIMEYQEPSITLFAKDFPNYFEAVINEVVIDANYANYDIRTSEFAESYFPAYGITSMLDLRIVRGGKIGGVICCEHVGEPRKWFTDESNFIQSVAEIIGWGLDAKDRSDTMGVLQAKEAETRELNSQLSGLVEEKTTALSDLQTAQQQLVQSEKMASLGQLVAGVAHEINTPISAVKASTRNLFRTLPIILTEVPTLLKNLSEEDSDMFLKLVNQSVEFNRDLTTQEERKYRMEVKSILDEYDIDNSFELAKELVEVRILDKIEEYIKLFDHPNSSDIIDKVYKVGQFKKNMDNIDLAADKTARVARALKNYSRVQAGETFTEVFLHESIETILTIYDNQLKYGINVEKVFEPMMKPVPVFPDEIGQVWTNIINNAVQAMKGKGKLKIEVYTEGENAIVKITDNGPGIPLDIVNRIFEPFFTTKPQGEGTGLGLDICKKIVEKHSGSLTVDTEPGRTTFITTLPMIQQQLRDTENG